MDMNDETKTKKAVQVFKALASESRINILQLLAGRALCVGALSDMTGISQGAVSQHLRVLKDAGLLQAERKGVYVHYQIPTEAQAQATAVLNHIFELNNVTSCQKGNRTCAKKKNVKSRNT